MRIVSHLVLLLLVVTSTSGCRQLLKNADKVGDVGKNADRVVDAGRRGDGAVETAVKTQDAWDHAAVAGAELAKMSLDVGPDVIENAREQLEEAGEHAEERDADLTGSWTSNDTTADGLVGQSRIERKKVGPSTYAFKQVLTMSQGGLQLATLRWRGVEAFGQEQVCAWADEVEVVQITDKLPAEAQAAMRNDATVATFNESPCTKLVELTVDKVVTKEGDDPVYTETRAK